MEKKRLKYERYNENYDFIVRVDMLLNLDMRRIIRKIDKDMNEKVLKYYCL